MNIVEKELTDSIKELVEKEDFEFVELKYIPQGRNSILRVYADTETGITINECQYLSRVISDYLFKRDKIEGSYILEVSSPGIKRPLKNKKDFIKNIGRDVEVKYLEKGEKKQISGRVERVSDNLVINDETNIEEIPFKDILKGKVILKW